MALPRNSWRVMAVVMVLAVTSLALADSPAQQQQVTVAITLSGSTVSVDRPRIEVRRGERVDWTSNVPFAVVVERHDSIFPNTPPQAMRGLANRPVRANVGGNAAPGVYKYTVVVWDAAAGDLRVLDPEIVVRPPQE
jgi:hypothetical protein